MNVDPLASHNAFDNDKRIRLDKETHIYYIDDRLGYTSATSLKTSLFYPFNAKKGSQMVVCNGNPKYIGMTPEEVEEQWSENAISKAELGSRLHLWIENFYTKSQNLKYPFSNGDLLEQYVQKMISQEITLDDFEDEDKSWVNFMRFVGANHDWIPYRMEWQIFHEKYKIAGTLDALFKVSHEGVDKFILCDWKRVEKIRYSSNFTMTPIDNDKLKGIPACNYWDYVIQLNIYRIILKDYYEIDVSYMFIVKLHENSYTFELHLVKEVEDMVRNMMKK